MGFDQYDYLLDELRLQGTILMELAKRVYNGVQLNEDGTLGPLAVVFTQQDHAFFAGLLSELVQREKAREHALVARGGHWTKSKGSIDLHNIDELLAVLTRMPEERAMQAILCSRAIGKKAIEMDIYHHLIHTAYDGRVGVKFPLDPSIVEGGEDNSPSSDDARSAWPHLEEPLKSEWKLQIEMMEASYAARSLKEMMTEYVEYLNETLDRYAFSIDSTLSAYNTRDDDGGTLLLDGMEGGSWGKYHDDFWKRRATVFERDDGTHLIEIVFEPKALAKFTGFGAIYDDIGKCWKAMATGEDDVAVAECVGHSRMEVIVGLVTPVRHVRIPHGQWPAGTLGAALGPEGVAELGRAAGELTTKEHDPLGLHAIIVTSSDRVTTTMQFAHWGLWSERCRLLTGLWELRNPGKGLKKDDRGDERTNYYDMPYTWTELVMLFGPMETD